MSYDELAMRLWVDGNLDVTTGCLSKEAAKRWQRLLMEEERLFYCLALYGFIKARRRDSGDPSCYPQDEFADFCGEFSVKLQLVLSGKSEKTCLPMFRRVGRATLNSVRWYARQH